MDKLQAGAFAWLSLVLVICLPPAGGLEATDSWRATMAAFLSHKELPELSLPAGAKPGKPPKDWQDGDVVCLALSKGSLPEAGYMLTDSAGQRILGFMAPWPTGARPCM